MEKERHTAEIIREEILDASAEHATVSLWNYVSILAWLRALRTIKVALIILPAVFGTVGSWYALNVPQSAATTAGLAALAGFFPVLYVAIGIDQSISNYRTLAGRYRRCHALFGDMARTSQRHSISELEARYEHVFNDYCHVREEAHTVPQWCFSRAEAAILRGDYTVNTLQKGAKDE